MWDAGASSGARLSRWRWIIRPSPHEPSTPGKDDHGSSYMKKLFIIILNKCISEKLPFLNVLFVCVSLTSRQLSSRSQAPVSMSKASRSPEYIAPRTTGLDLRLKDDNKNNKPVLLVSSQDRRSPTLVLSGLPESLNQVVQHYALGTLRSRAFKGGRWTIRDT
jgi:hypothetical protein